MYYPAREEDDEYCMKCGGELLDNIPNICTNCNEPRRLANTIVNPTLVENDYVRYCHVCGNDCTRIKCKELKMFHLQIERLGYLLCIMQV